MRNNRGYSLRFCDDEELNVFLEFIETYPDEPDTPGEMKHLAEKLRNSISDKYGNEVTPITIPLWFEDVPTVILSLWIAYVSWDQSEFGVRAEKARDHDDDLWEKRQKVLRKRQEEESKKLMETLMAGVEDTSSSDKPNSK